MRRYKQILSFSFCIICAVLGYAQNKTTVIYQDNSDSKGKVEWTRSVEVNDAVIGEPKKIKIPVKNISDAPLYIVSTKTHCGCIEATPPKDSIAPGGIGYIDVVYKAKPRTETDKHGFEKIIPPPFTFYQIIDVTTNFDPKNVVLLNVQGTVVR